MHVYKMQRIARFVSNKEYFWHRSRFRRDRGFEVFGTCCFFDLLVVLVGAHASRVIAYVARKQPRGVVDVQAGGFMIVGVP